MGKDKVEGLAAYGDFDGLLGLCLVETGMPEASYPGNAEREVTAGVGGGHGVGRAVEVDSDAAYAHAAGVAHDTVYRDIIEVDFDIFLEREVDLCRRVGVYQVGCSRGGSVARYWEVPVMPGRANNDAVGGRGQVDEGIVAVVVRRRPIPAGGDRGAYYGQARLFVGDSAIQAAVVYIDILKFFGSRAAPGGKA